VIRFGEYLATAGLHVFEEIIIDGFFSQYFSIIIAHGF